MAEDVAAAAGGVLRPPDQGPHRPARHGPGPAGPAPHAEAGYYHKHTHVIGVQTAACEESVRPLDKDSLISKHRVVRQVAKTIKASSRPVKAANAHMWEVVWLLAFLLLSLHAQLCCPHGVSFTAARL